MRNKREQTTVKTAENFILFVCTREEIKNNNKSSNCDGGGGGGGGDGGRTSSNSNESNDDRKNKINQLNTHQYKQKHTNTQSHSNTCHFTIPCCVALTVSEPRFYFKQYILPIRTGPKAIS